MERITRGSKWREWRKGWTRKSGSYGVVADASADASVDAGTNQGQWSLTSGTAEADNGPRTWSAWSQDFVHWLSYHGRVEHVVALGSVLAISLKDDEGAGTYPLLFFPISFPLSLSPTVFPPLTNTTSETHPS